MAKIRTISLEFLRHGPAHNQLLSPLTQYLGLCGNHGASTMQVPYEHQEFMSRLKSLRYDDGMRSDDERRHIELSMTAAEMTDIFASVPGLVSGLGTIPDGDMTIMHIDLILSASELAMLPFELARVPPGCAGGAGNHLLLQTQLPVCLTRRVRSVFSENYHWPQKPKILFITAQHQNMSVPAHEHTKALIKAIKPWIPTFRPSDPADRNKKISEILTVLNQATVKEIEAACADRSYTHVHILAHGMENKKLPGKPYGLALHNAENKSIIDVVCGQRLASALNPLRRLDKAEVRGNSGMASPAVVTVAACDSGNVRSVIYNNGASLAHALHQAGIPFVVASQFPLSKRGSVHVAELLYSRMLRGEDPRTTLHHLRSRLNALSADNHDWASLVTYAALPDNLEYQLKDVQFNQAKAAIDIKMDIIDRKIDSIKIRKKIEKGAVPQESDDLKIENEIIELVKQVDKDAEWLPTRGDYEVQGTGMIASNEKRQAEAYWRASQSAYSPESRSKFAKRSFQTLQKSLDHYKKAYGESMREREGAIRRRRSLHWPMGQYLSLRAVLNEPFLRNHWGAAIVSTKVDLLEAQGDAAVWPYPTLAELYMILLAYDPKEVPFDNNNIRDKIESHIEHLLDTVGYDSFVVYSTLRQFKRYITWWGSEEFESLLKDEGRKRKRSWAEDGGIIEIAEQVVKKLER